MTDKTREEFEVWFSRSGMEKFKETAWAAWQASRESLTIELPTDLDWRSAAETRDMCADRVRAAGVKVKATA